MGRRDVKNLLTILFFCCAAARGECYKIGILDVCMYSLTLYGFIYTGAAHLHRRGDRVWLATFTSVLFFYLLMPSFSLICAIN